MPAVRISARNVLDLSDILQHGQALPQAATESAREARKSFFCQLCQKGYARMNEFEAHEGSYDHQHRKRLKEMKQISKDPTLAARAREQETQNSGLKSVATPSIPLTNKKKPVFKSTMQPQNVPAKPLDVGKSVVVVVQDGSGAVRNGWAERAYDPIKGPTNYDPDLRIGELVVD
ncbi:G patch domain-containing 8 [Lecanosticta acicola]|uniref:G patch domain-containing 8 n=1 Tax=Lecanosticta acicola TaxID=111012 RepID=A0AAI8Z9E4_9PEZI|nr:G patch domain-containing 8 [Lecanosticta acicola]